MTTLIPSEEAILSGDGRVETPAARGRLSDITVADGLMALIGALAFWLRFGDLARLPLSAAEATAALANWQFLSAGGVQAPPASPAYFTFTNLIMGLGGDGDAAARLVPAAFGVLTVLLPWLWRDRARPVIWLAAGLFMAVSPMLTAVSRTAGGDAIALFALLLMAVAGLDIEAGGRGRAIALGIGVGLGLTSSPLFYTGLIALLPAAWVFAADRTGLTMRPLRIVAAAAGITFLAVATSVLLYPAGIGAALRLLPQWLSQFGPPADGTSLFAPWLALLRYEPAIFVLGVPAAAWTILHGNRRGVGLAVWLGVLLLFILLQAGFVANAAAALLPGYLLVGALAAAVAAQRDVYPGAGRRTAWATAVGLVGLGALVLTAFGRFARLNLLTEENATLISLAALAFVLAGLAVVLAMAWENAAARRGAFAGLVLLLLFWQWGSAWQLSRLGANDPREHWVVAGTDDDVQVMSDLLLRVSRQTANSDHDLTVFSQVESPVLAWYLRGLTGYQAGATVPVGSQADVVIAPVETQLSLPNTYFGLDFGLEQRELPPDGGGTVSDGLKWLLFRESAAPVETQRVVVWIRSDLANQ